MGRVRGSSALVLGSSQDRSVVDEGRAAARGIEVIRRSTGGGVVLVAPDAQVWLDLWVPRGDDLWEDDIIRSASWLGEAWLLALEGLGAGPLQVHQGRASRRPLSDLICFGGLGPGEVYGAGPGPESKVVGIAQRRTRLGARFHTSAPLSWDPTPWVDLLHLERNGSVAAGRRLDDVAVGLRAVVRLPDPDVLDVDLIGVVEDAVIASLP
jgi:lipoate-protein ligase A